MKKESRLIQWLKHFVLLIVIIAIAFQMHAQTVPEIEWQKSLGGTGIDNAYSIQQTRDEGFIVAGLSSSNDGDVSGNHGNTDYWVVKLNTSGNIGWQRCLGGTSNDYAYCIQQTTDEGFIVAGLSYSNDGNVSGNHGNDDFWIVKLDTFGNIEWQKSFGGSLDEYAYSIQQTREGGFIVAGVATSMDGDVNGNDTNEDYWIVKLDASGNITWKNSFGGSYWDLAYSIHQTTDGGFIVAGVSNSSDGDVSGWHEGYDEDNDPANDYWIVKIDSLGSIEWQKSLGGSGIDYAYSIQQTTDSGFVVAGFSWSIDGDVSGNHGNTDYWIVKLDASGNIEWQKCLGGSGYDSAFSIQQSTDGGFVVVGQSSSNDGDAYGNHNGFGYWIVKLTSSGNLEWQKWLADNPAHSILQTTDGGFVTAGGNYDFGIIKFFPENNSCTQSNVPSVTASSNTICRGNSTSLSIVDGNLNSATDWKWYTNNCGEELVGSGSSIEVSPDTTTTYYVRGEGGCVTPGECATAEIIVNPLPHAKIGARGNLDICNTGFVNLIAAGGSDISYRWLKNGIVIPGATDPFYHANKLGDYRVHVINANGCGAFSKKITVYSSCKLGEETGLTSSLNIYPNPTSGNFTLDLTLDDEETTDAQVQIGNLLGQIIFSEDEKVSNGKLQQQIQLSDEAAGGMYMVKVIINDKIFTSQINYQK